VAREGWTPRIASGVRNLPTHMSGQRSRVAFTGTVFASYERTCHARTPCDNRYSASLQPFRFAVIQSGLVPDCEWNCQLAAGDHQPVPDPLVAVMGHLLGNDAASRRTGSSCNSFGSACSDQRQISTTAEPASNASPVSYDTIEQS